MLTSDHPLYITEVLPINAAVEAVSTYDKIDDVYDYDMRIFLIG